MTGKNRSRAGPHKRSLKKSGEGFGWRDLAVRPWLWLPPRLAHDLSPHLLKISSRWHAARLFAAGKWPAGTGGRRDDSRRLRPGPYKWGGFFWRNLYFPNPLGPAGGLDKNSLNVRDWWILGAGFCETGTVTPMPQGPNKGKILDRSLRHAALWNRMGFPNRGLDFARARLKSLPAPQFFPMSLNKKSCRADEPLFLDVSNREARPAPVFVNIGKNRETPLDRAEEDYSKSLKALCHLADVFVINISSPNTEGLREIFGKKRLPGFLKSLKQALKEAAPARCPPLILKLSPDAGESDFLRLVDQSLEAGIDGFCLGNSSIRREGAPPEFPPYGGVSGRPAAHRSRLLLKKLAGFMRRRGARGRLIISCGGILSPEDVFERLEEGADLVQAYSAFAFNGPGFLRRASALAGRRGACLPGRPGGRSRAAAK